MWFSSHVAVDHIDRQSHTSHGVAHVGDTDIGPDLSLDLLHRREVKRFKLRDVVTFLLCLYCFFHLFDFDANDSLDKGSDVVLAQVVNVVVPVAHFALFLPWGELTRVDATEVAKEDIEA